MPGRKGRGVVFTTGDGFYFAKNGKCTETRKYVKCTECSVRAVINGNILTLSNAEHTHSHAPEVDSAKLSELKDRLKKRARETVGPLKDVFNNVCNE